MLLETEEVLLQSFLHQQRTKSWIVDTPAINNHWLLRPVPTFLPKMEIPNHFQQSVCRPNGPLQEQQLLAVGNEGSAEAGVQEGGGEI